MIKRIILQIIYKIFGQNIYEEFIKIYTDYYVSFLEKKPLPLQIYCLDGNFSTCGFADRLRGIITTYAYAKARHLPFRIQHEVPFKNLDSTYLYY